MNEIDGYLANLDEAQQAICRELMRFIGRNAKDSSVKLYHGSPVWFMDDNPLFGFSIKKGNVALLFWSGQSFSEDGLTPIGKHKAAEQIIKTKDDINSKKLEKWISESLTMQWNYRDIIKNKGSLELLIKK